jgi:hypothetical protein
MAFRFFWLNSLMGHLVVVLDLEKKMFLKSHLCSYKEATLAKWTKV